MPDHIPSNDADDEYIPWDVDAPYDDQGNYDYGESGFEDSD